MDIAQELAIIADLLDPDEVANEPEYSPQHARVIREAVRLLIEAERILQGYESMERRHDWCRRLRSSLLERKP